MRSMILCVLSVTTLVGLSAPAVARETAEMRIKIGDLDLHSQAGAKTFMSRLHRGVVRFCSYDGRTVRYQTATIRDCQIRMSTQAVRQLDAPMVTAMYSQRLSPAQRVELAER